jgi:hypothetical protein
MARILFRILTNQKEEKINHPEREREKKKIGEL